MLDMYGIIIFFFFLFFFLLAWKWTFEEHGICTFVLLPHDFLELRTKKKCNPRTFFPESLQIALSYPGRSRTVNALKVFLVKDARRGYTFNMANTKELHMFSFSWCPTLGTKIQLLPESRLKFILKKKRNLPHYFFGLFYFILLYIYIFFLLDFGHCQMWNALGF